MPISSSLHDLRKSAPWLLLGFVIGGVGGLPLLRAPATVAAPVRPDYVPLAPGIVRIVAGGGAVPLAPGDYRIERVAVAVTVTPQ